MTDIVYDECRRSGLSCCCEVAVMRNSLGLLGLLSGLAIVASCSAIGDAVQGDGTGGGSGGWLPGSGGGMSQGGGKSTGAGQGGDINITVGVGGGSTGSSSGNACVSGPDEDKDQDGFTTADGDCNDCDPNVNPGALEVVAQPDMNGNTPDPADEDCDGQVDNVLAACDMGLALDNVNPQDGARAIDLCQFTTASERKWGVLEAKYVRANGTTANPGQQVGLLDKFGTNVNVQGGSRMLVISSGRARTPGQTGACNKYSCTGLGAGQAPPGFPQDVPNCPGETDINDDVGLQVKIRSPKNATGYLFNFNFYTFEYPEWVCDFYNDQFIALVSPPPAGSINGNISFDSQTNPVSVNIAFFSVCPGCPLGTGELTGTGFDTWDDAGATSWLKTQAPIKGGDEVTIRFTIWDTGDSSWDSTALIDNFQWIANGGTVVVGTDPVPIPK